MRKPGLVHEGVPQSVVTPDRPQRGRRAAVMLCGRGKRDSAPRGCSRGVLGPRAGGSTRQRRGPELYPRRPTSDGFASPWVVSVGKHTPHDVKGCVFDVNLLSQPTQAAKQVCKSLCAHSCIFVPDEKYSFFTSHLPGEPGAPRRRQRKLRTRKKSVLGAVMGGLASAKGTLRDAEKRPGLVARL